MQEKSESYALYTDHYEFTMLDALVQSGQARKGSTFEVFARELPLGRSFGVFAGISRLLPKLENFYFSDDILRFLREEKIVSKQTLEFLSSFSFTGDIVSYQEGETYFPYSPVITVEGNLGEALLIETLLLSIINFDSAIATAAARIVLAANGHLVMEAGSRRIEPEAAVNAARAAYIGGVEVTSNLEAGRRWGIPTAGTASHAYTLSFQSEMDAFENQAKYLGENSIFLVDTYNIETGIVNAIKASNAKLKGIRIDSGDLATSAKSARELLDGLGAPQAQIMVSGDLDEYKIRALADAPIDAFESGHRLVTGSGAASAGFVYKLVAIEDNPSVSRMRPVQKQSEGKTSLGGKKLAKRKVGFDGVAVEESIFIDGSSRKDSPSEGYRDLQSEVMSRGKILNLLTVEDSRNHLMKIMPEIPKEVRLRVDGEPAIPTIMYEGKQK
ncbi:MAG: nicotinate phosphoribosyltransferase [Acidimicrobiaceae bacterium]|nr:nicotinate phosphoribosyltransferase [Acidimicrobiaceae bacterium]|tara:strand:- start:1461 stop:2789 length:1329 start_codon:yes stop_codon:yes gene_type:complete